MPAQLSTELLSSSAFVIIEHLPSDVEGEPTVIYIPEWPDSIADKVESNFNSTNALSRTAPVFSYINSGPRSVTVVLTLQRGMMDEANENKCNVKPGEDQDYVDLFVSKLQSVAYPNFHSSSKEIEPPQVIVCFGEQLQIEGIINSGISVEYEKPLLENGKYSTVNISFTVYEIHPEDALTKSEIGSLGEIPSTMRDLIGYYSSN